ERRDVRPFPTRRSSDLQANLPEAVKQFIPEHHGTQKIAYFLEQARRRDESVDASEFTYQGPKPQSRETAILMLADSIESAMKVLDRKSTRLNSSHVKIS